MGIAALNPSPQKGRRPGLTRVIPPHTLKTHAGWIVTRIKDDTCLARCSRQSADQSSRRREKHRSALVRADIATTAMTA